MSLNAHCPKAVKLPADEIKRVKGLGCLQDKRFPDVFNVRVITRNGKITVAEHYAVAEGAERFGSGEASYDLSPYDGNTGCKNMRILML